jgi:hypothetical protein
MQIDTTSVLVLFTVFAVIIVALVYIKRRVDFHRRMEEISEQEFETSVLRSFGNGTAGAWTAEVPVSEKTRSGAETLQMNAAPPELKAAPVRAQNLHDEAFNPYMQNIDVVAAAVVTRLRSASLTEGIAERLELHGNPNGAGILPTRSGRKYLVLPGIESEAYLRRNLKRFDGIMIVTQDGDAIVITSVADLIASNF